MNCSRMLHSLGGSVASLVYLVAKVEWTVAAPKLWSFMRRNRLVPSLTGNAKTKTDERTFVGISCIVQSLSLRAETRFCLSLLSSICLPYRHPKRRYYHNCQHAVFCVTHFSSRFASMDEELCVQKRVFSVVRRRWSADRRGDRRVARRL